jgi:hypothetical protein
MTKDENITRLFKDLTQEICSLHPIVFEDIQKELHTLLKVRYNILKKLN